MTDLTGKTLGDYCVLRQLGAGGMAEVYLANQESLSRQVALKVLQPALASDASYVQRFTNEARAAASLVHANIVQIYEVGRAEGIHFIAQEYVPGKNLSEVLRKQGSLPPRLVLDVLRQVAAALHKASEQGIVHRDIKPENLLLSSSGEVKVADFGLARVLNVDAQALSSPALTQVGVAMGTPLYMSPEQIESRDVDFRSDLYSLGVTAYHLLAGEPPHTGETALAIAVQHLNVQPKPLREVREDVPAGMVRVIKRLMAKQPADRYDSPAELLTELRELASQAKEEGWGDGPESWPLAEWISGANSSGKGNSANGMASSSSSTTRKLSQAMQTLTSLQPSKSSRIRRFVLVGCALLAGGLLSLVTRPKNYLRGNERPEVVKRETAWEQIYQANLAPSEAAWQAVEKYFPEADAYEKQLAEQGLVRYYLLLSEENKKALAKLRELDRNTQQGDAPDATNAFTIAALVITEARLGNDVRARTELGRLTTEMSDSLRRSDSRLFELLDATRKQLGQ
ncbi:serine/threonine-protein kinase [Adhaeretor mobilis]|uniref:non-specific serine/threonine protein kinase n=1 Tax=Adhaeretor mobilis TaxID=1930276 RepID=A0A517N292_9BACT|nr:serine/threonine-protein kinase [Adhaeretor mobilis]QDT01259.1 Serine/threonine-protein kinase PrkC [Adhaeretor mobilis]